MKIYLSHDGVARVATACENSHYGMAKAILKIPGDSEDMYAEMWRQGWVRVVELDDRVDAEKYLNGTPVRFEDLPRAQIEWLEDRALQGKTLCWNSKVCESICRGGISADRQAEALTESGLRKSTD